MEKAYDNGEKEAFIIGGGTIYEQTQELWDKLYITEVDLDVEGDIYFPKIDYSRWKSIQDEAHLADEKNEFNYRFKIYERK